MSGGRQTVVVFDLDGTITRHDTYLQYLIGYLQYKPSRLLATFALPVDLCRFALGAVDNAYVKARFLQAILAGNSRSELRVWTETFLHTLCQRGLRPGALARIAQHRTQGDRLILATASFDFYVQPLARRLGFDEVICTQSLWNTDDRLLGGLNGPNCYGAVKLQRLYELLGTDVRDVSLLAYSDHHADLPLLTAATRAVAVNPTRKLQAAAAVYGFAIEHWG
jgi:HAD superfamily hydrolase (TIGR01490 family)